MNNATQIDTGFIVLEHDLFVQQVEIATGYILPAALAFDPKLTIEPIITCLNKPLQDAYIETNDNKTNPPIVSGQYLILGISLTIPSAACIKKITVTDAIIFFFDISDPVCQSLHSNIANILSSEHSHSQRYH